MQCNSCALKRYYLFPQGAGGSEPLTEPFEQKRTVNHHHQHPVVQTLPITPACCVIASDPATAFVPELSFPKVMLTDHSRRAELFCWTQSVMSATLERSASSNKRTWCGRACTIGADQSSLLELLRRTSEAETEHEGKALDSSCLTPVEVIAERTNQVKSVHISGRGGYYSPFTPNVGCVPFVPTKWRFYRIHFTHKSPVFRATGLIVCSALALTTTLNITAATTATATTSAAFQSHIFRSGRGGLRAASEDAFQ